MCKTTKILSILLCLLLIFEQSGFAQMAGQLDISGYLAGLRNTLTQDKFRPLHLRYLSYDTLNNNFRLLLDKGDLKDIKAPQVQETTQKLLEYFFVGVSLPNSSFWVNLRPDSPDNIIDPYLAQTDVGKILLEADLQLKKDTAKFTSPEKPKGKEYWDKLYKKAGELFGYDNITIPTLTRPWIVPDEIIVREANDNAYIYKATLKVQLEQDYLKDSAVYNFDDPRLKELNEYSSQLIRELIIPELTKEINNAKRYASLRQVYYSLILAQWFKQKFASKGGFYSSLIDRRNLNGITSKEDWSKTNYFKAYQKSFKDGEYNIKEPIYTTFGQTIRSYFSGGIDFGVSQGQGVGVIATAIQQDLVKAATPGEVLVGNSHTLPVDINQGGTLYNVGVDKDAIRVGKIQKSSSPLGQREVESQNINPRGKDHSLYIGLNEIITPPVRTPNKIPLILITGFPGAGKSTVGNSLNQKLGIPFISLGAILRQMWQKDPTIPNYPELGFEKLKEYIQKENIDINYGVILDSNIPFREWKELLDKFLEENNFYLAAIINVNSPEEIVRQRAWERERPEDKKPLKVQDYIPGEIETRMDKRIAQHKRIAIPVIEDYRKEGFYIELNNEGNLELLEEKVRDALNRLIDLGVINQVNRLRVYNNILKKAVANNWSLSDIWNFYIPIAESIIEIQEKGEKKLIIGIGGPTGSGKSVFSLILREVLAQFMGDESTGIIKQDNFFYTDDELERFNITRRNAPDSVRIDWILERINNFKNNKPINQPKLEKTEGKRIRLDAEEAVKAESILIVDGVYVLNNDTPEYRKLFDEFNMRIFIDADSEDIEDWWIDREFEKGRGSKENLSRKWQDELSLFIEQQKNLWINSDLIIKKGQNHALENVYLISPMGKGFCLDKVKEISLNILHQEIRRVIGDLEKLAENAELSTNEQNRASVVIEKLAQLEKEGKIGSFDLIAKGKRDYLLGFADVEKEKIGLAHEFFRQGKLLNKDLNNAIFYLGYILTFNLSYQAADYEYSVLQKKIFGKNEVLSQEGIIQTVTDTINPQQVYYLPLKTAELEKLDSYEGIGSLNLARLLVKDIIESCGGRSPKVMFVTPTQKGGGVTALVKDIAEVLFSPEIGIKGGWLSTVRHQNPDFWGISGKFQRALDGSPEEITDSDMKLLDNAMAWNAERLDLEEVNFIFLHDPFTLGMIPFIRKKYPHVKIIWVNHGDISRATDAAKGLMKKYLASADIAIFSWMKDYIPKDGVGIPAIHMIHGLNLTNTKNIELSSSFINAVASRYGIDPNRPAILHVGRFNPSKDPLQSIASFLRLKKILVERGINVKPQLILSGIPISPGDWTLYNHLMKLKEHLGDSDIHIIASDNQVTELTKDEKDALTSMGFDLSNAEPWELSDLEMNALQKMATMGIHPAITEGFGLVISEALIKGTPVIASAVGGIPMQIEDKRFLINLSETHKNEIGKKYGMLNKGQFDSLLDLLNGDPVTLSFATNMLNVLEMDRHELERLIAKAKSRIFANYSILRSLIGHLTVIDLLAKGEQNKICRSGIIIEDESVVLCKDLISGLKREGLDAEDFSIIKNKIVSFGETALELVIDEIKNSRTESYDYRFRLQKVLSEIGIRYIPRIIQELGTEDEYIREQFYWTLVFMGEVPMEDLINSIESNANPYVTRGAIQTLVRIGYMGNGRITEALKNYLSDTCKATYEEIKSHFGLLEPSDYETLGHICMLISNFNNIKGGEVIAARLLQRGFYPSQDIIEKISNEVGDKEKLYSKIEEMLQSLERRMRQIEINGDFSPKNPLDLVLGYTILLKEAKEKQIVLRVSYEEYEHLIKTGKETPNLVLDNADSLTEKQIAELNYLSSEALRLRQFIFEVQNKAKKLGLPLLVIANKTYGEIAISSIEEDLVKNGITVFKRRLASDKTHLYPYYMEGNLFSDEEIRFIVNQRPIIIVVDGTNSLRRTVLELFGRRSRAPHYPDAYLGYRNYFIAMSQALGAKVLPPEFHISTETLKILEASSQFMRIKEKIASVATAVSPEGYRMFFWSNSGFGLPIREDRKGIETPNNIDANDIKGPAIIFAQTCTSDENISIQTKTLTHNIAHTPGYYDIAFEELGYRNFFFDITIDNFGPHLKSFFKDNKSIAEEYASLNTYLKTLEEFTELNIKPLSYEENVHIKYEKVEKAILELQRYYEDLIKKRYSDLMRALESQDITQSIKLLERLIILRKGLHSVLKARKKFIKLGWPCRHSHTNFDGDDGDLTPEELVEHAIANGITVLYVTGHNTLEGSIQAIEYTKKKNYIIEIIPGVEIETPFEGEKGELFGFMHWRIIGPNDTVKIEKMRGLIREIDRRLEIFLGTKFERILSLADRSNFERLVTSDVIEKLKNHYDIKRGNFILAKDSQGEIKDRLYKALQELQDYVKKAPRTEYMPKFLNKLNIIGSWTTKIWDDKGDTRRALRVLSDILFSDTDIIIWMKQNGLDLPISTQEALRKFSEMRCYSIAAHPSLEISKGDVEKGKFMELTVIMAKDNILQGAGRGWKDARGSVDDMIDQIAKLSDVSFRKDGSNPDFHGPKKSNIKLGDKLPSGEYAQDGEEPDREGYFIESEFLSRGYLNAIEKLITENRYLLALEWIRILDEINPYSDACGDLLNRLLLNYKGRYVNEDLFQDKSSGSSPVQSSINSASINSLDSKDHSNKKGGIDFRVLPIATQPLNTPRINIPLGRLDNFMADPEWKEIQNMVNAGIIPSGQRIKDYLQSCCQKKELNREIARVLSCIADIMRIEEERVLATDQGLKSLLVLVESDKSDDELLSALSRINFSPKEPEPVTP